MQYKSERRELRRRNARKMGVAGRSVFLLMKLAGRPKPSKWLHSQPEPPKEKS